MSQRWLRLPSGILLIGVFGVGAYRAQSSPDGFDGVMMMTAALIPLGVWIAVELHDCWHNDDQGDHDEERR